MKASIAVKLLDTIKNKFIVNTGIIGISALFAHYLLSNTYQKD